MVRYAHHPERSRGIEYPHRILRKNILHFLRRKANPFKNSPLVINRLLNASIVNVGAEEDFFVGVIPVKKLLEKLNRFRLSPAIMLMGSLKP